MAKKAPKIQEPKELKQYLVGVYGTEEQILAVTAAVVQAGLPVHDTFTPYAVHGLDTAQGLPRSKLTYVTGIGGLLGLLTALTLQIYTQSIETPFWSGWPLNVGGKPFMPLTAFVPVSFELTVLFGGLITVGGLLSFCGLLPGRKPRLHIEGVTNDRFAIALDPTGLHFDEAQAKTLLSEHGALEIAYVEENA